MLKNSKKRRGNATSNNEDLLIMINNEPHRKYRKVSTKTQNRRNIFRNMNGVIAQLFESYGFILVDQNVDEAVLKVCEERRLYFKLNVVRNDPFQLKPKSDVTFSLRINDFETSRGENTSTTAYEIFDVALKYCRSEEQIYGSIASSSYNGNHINEQESSLTDCPSSSTSEPVASLITCDAVIVSWNRSGRFCFVTPNNVQFNSDLFKERNFYLHFSNLLNFDLDLIPGDILSVTIDPKEADKMRIRYAVLSEIVLNKRRAVSSVYDIAFKVSQFLKRVDVDENLVVQQLSSNLAPKAVIKLFAQQSNRLEHSQKMMILKVTLELVMFCLKHFTCSYNRELIHALVSSGFFEKSKSLYDYIVTKHKHKVSTTDEEGTAMDISPNNYHIDLSNIKSFLIETVRLLPEYGRKIHKLVNLYPKLFGCDFFTEMLEITTKPFAVKMEDLNYKEIKLVLTNEELQQMLLDERSFLNISPVIKQGSYDSVEEYIETYFKLLRYDCFFNLLVGIKKYLSGDLDLRDMNVAVEGSLWALGVEDQKEFSSTPVDVLVVTAMLLRKNKTQNLLESRSFMYGNLVAISSSGLFNDIIWATVFHREDQMADGKVTIYLEYASEVNSLSFLEAVETLLHSSGVFVLAESPTYYKSYQPVLRAMQQLKTDKFPFSSELVMAQKPQNAQSPYEDFSFKPSVLFDLVNDELLKKKINQSADAGVSEELKTMLKKVMVRSSVSRFLEKENMFKECQCFLDSSQQVAIKSLLQNRIAIVQGPPGTGKTYLGVHFLKVLLGLKGEEFEIAIDGPILVLTYKNHALDEFSKQIVNNRDELSYYGSFIRVGGRSKDPAMKEYGLSNFVKSEGSLCGNLQQKLREISQNIKTIIGKFCQSCTTLRTDVVEKHFDNVQIANLLRGFSSKDKRSGKIIENAAMYHGGIEQVACVLYNVMDTQQYHVNIEMLYSLFTAALAAWLPSDSVTARVRDEESKKRYDNIKKAQLYERINETSIKEKETEVDGAEDPVAIQKIIEERLETATVGDCRNTNDRKRPEIILKTTQNNPYHNQLPKCMQTLGNVSKTIGAKTDLKNWKYISNPWELTEVERVHFLQAMLVKQSEYAAKELQTMFSEYEMLRSQIVKLKQLREVEALREARVIAMTITGASMRADVLRSVQPSVIVVEEAAEINEAQIIALLGEHVKHLVLIGDHKQLRPQVECFELVKKFNFDVSMMERLINNGLPYATLSTQNRMRPDISKYLRDIYPDLLDNRRVLKNLPVRCIDSNIFFWNHNFPEKSLRSHSNPQEAQTVIDLVNFLTEFNGYPVSSITVLSAYKSQTAALRKLAHKDKSLSNQLDIQTIDMFQGDENNIVIVSLVRCNPERNPGFLGILNRRCVAQSRARCGLYFVGNAATLRTDKKFSKKSNVWATFLDELEKDGNIGNELKIKCKNHDHSTQSLLVGQKFPEKSTTFCDQVCNVKNSCGLHCCTKTCQPYHDDSHTFCKTLTEFSYKCNVHQGKKLCHQVVPICPNPCNFIFHEDDSSGLDQHPCTAICGSYHDHEKCKTTIRFLCPDNVHPMTRFCCDSESKVLCRENVSFTYSFCNFHTGTKKCYEDPSKFECRHTCIKLMDPCQHPCFKYCQPSHSHDKREVNCTYEVTFTYPQCGRHRGTKLCYETAEDKKCPQKCGVKLETCDHLCEKPCYPSHSHSAHLSECVKDVLFPHTCGHTLLRQCKEKQSEIICDKPCSGRLQCGHWCPLTCQPEHSHENNISIVCEQTVSFTCSRCLTQSFRKCFQKVEEIICESSIVGFFAKCMHRFHTKCHEDQSKLLCEEQCQQRLKECGHRCKMVCSSEHSHESSVNCTDSVSFAHHCGFRLTRKCNQLESSVNCTGPCQKRLSCGHNCTAECGLNHEHNYPCLKIVTINCSSCGTESQKNCSEKRDEIKCTGKMKRKCTKCKESSSGPCVKSVEKFECSLPCVKKLKECGHTCSQKCFEECNVLKCKPCILGKKEQENRERKLREEQAKIEIRAKRKELQEEEETMLQNVRLLNVQKYEIRQDSNACDEYFSMKTFFMKYITIEPGYIPKINKIFKIYNAMANKELIRCQRKLHDPRRRLDFCYLVTEGSRKVEEYCNEGFFKELKRRHTENNYYKLHDMRKRKSEGFIKFSSRSPKVHVTWEDDILSVLFCNVAVGKCKTIHEEKEIPDSNGSFRREFDSVFLLDQNQSEHSQYLIFDPCQIAVTGFVNFALEPQEKLLTKGGSADEDWVTGEFQKLTLELSREFHFMDSRETYLRMAESQFYRHNRTNSKITHIDLFLNPLLEEKFLNKKEEFKQTYASEPKLFQEIWTFHGTPIPDPEVIMKENFRLDIIKRTLHGFGIYFSEFPHEALRYAGDGSLLLARVLPGRQATSECENMKGGSGKKLCETHDSHLVNPGSKNYSEMVIIQNVDQILPMFIIHVEKVKTT